MENVVNRSKFVNETISIVFDFSDQLRPGESVSSCTIVVSPFTGTDSDPSNILYQVPLITGNTVDQKFRLGVPGCIYEISFLAVGSLGTHAEKVTNLAILPQDGIAIPSFTVIYETSCLYPYGLSDSLRGGVSWVHGFMGYVSPPDAVNSGVSWISGSIAGTIKSYSIPAESLNSGVIWVSGEIAGTSVNYPIQPDGVTAGIAWIAGSIAGTSISYSVPFESLTSSVGWFSGSIN